jgi:phage portal protein BeeE
MNIPIPRFLANWLLNKYGENLIRNQSQKASKIDKILVSPGSGSAKWSEHDYENFAKETYLKNIIAFRCIDILGTAFSSVPWKVYEVKGSNNKTETKEHPVAK